MHGLRAANDEGIGRPLVVFRSLPHLSLGSGCRSLLPARSVGGATGPVYLLLRGKQRSIAIVVVTHIVCRQHASSRDCPLMPLSSSTQPKRRAQKSTG